MTGADTSIGDADNGSIVHVPRDGTLTIRLAGNRTTGFRWSLAGDAPPNVRLISDGYERSAEAAAGRVGAGGTEVFSFAATAPGRGIIALAYHRGSEAPARQFTVTLVVDAP